LVQNIKNQLSGSLSQLGDQSSGTEDKLRGLQESLEEVEVGYKPRTSGVLRGG